MYEKKSRESRQQIFFVYFFGGLEHFVYLRDVCIRTQRAAVASRRATNLATHLPNIPTDEDRKNRFYTYWEKNYFFFYFVIRSGKKDRNVN